MNDFLNKNQLPKKYLAAAEQIFSALLCTIQKLASETEKTLFVGINGCQGSGKTTLADYLVWQLNKTKLNAISCSLDDFYLDTKKRILLADTVHPLLKTRGVPGTHNIALLKQTMANFTKHKVNWKLSKFSKVDDNPLPEHLWPIITDKLNIVIIEGWCWGVPAQTESALTIAVNDFEKTQDNSGEWRNYVNQQLKTHYQQLFKQMDLTVMLKAPSFECVYQWRLEQERKLSQTNQGLVMNENDIAQFIQYFQRLTEHALTVLPQQVDFLFELDKNRQITRALIK